MKFLTKLFHPNVYTNGSICLDILQNQWSPIYDVAAILTSIQSLLTDPNPNSPANVEAAKLYQENRREYEKKVEAMVMLSWEEEGCGLGQGRQEQEEVRRAGVMLLLLLLLKRNATEPPLLRPTFPALSLLLLSLSPSSISVAILSVFRFPLDLLKPCFFLALRSRYLIAPSSLHNIQMPRTSFPLACMQPSNLSLPRPHLNCPLSAQTSLYAVLSALSLSCFVHFMVCLVRVEGPIVEVG